MAKSKRLSKKLAANKKTAVSKKSTKSSKKPRVTKVITPKHAKVKVKVVKDKKKKPTASSIEVVSGFERYKMIEVAAYYLAEQNSFAGNAADYWVEAEKLIDAKVTVNDAPQAPKPTSRTRRKKDGLTIVEGIGPKIESLLVADGIKTLADLAKAKTSALSEILKKAGARYSMHKPDTWPQQAALARDEKFDELKALQDKLDGGRL